MAATLETLKEVTKPYREKWDALEQPKKVKALVMAASLSYFFFFVVLIVYTVSGVKRATTQRSSVVVFMESNPEDIFALRYLLKRSDITVSAVILTLNSWNQNLLSQYETTLSFLSMLNAEGSAKAASIPVYYGTHLALRNADFDDVLDLRLPTQPSVTSCSYTRIWTPALQMASETMFGVSYSLPRNSATSWSPVYYFDPLTALLSASPDRSVTALCLSTATDFVNHWTKNPTLRSKWVQVVVSGGAIGGANGGDVKNVFPLNANSEFNFFLDPRAANVLVQSVALQTNVLLVTYDSSVKASLKPTDYNNFFVSAGLGSNSSRAFASLMLTRKRTAVPLASGQPDLSPPQDLVAAAVMSDVFVRQASVMGSARLRVVSDAQLRSDGSVTSTTATGVPFVPYVSSVDAGALLAHLTFVEAARFPRP